MPRQAEGKAVTDKLHRRIRQALVQAGYTNPRTGEHSVRALTRDLDLNNSRVSRYLHQGSKMQIEAREMVADALGFDLSELDSLVSGHQVETYSPPDAANRLGYRERRLINELIHVLADRETEEVKANAEHPTPIVDDTDEPLPTQAEVLDMAAYRPAEDESDDRERRWADHGEESQDHDDA